MYVKTSYSTTIRIVCGCGANKQKTIDFQDSVIVEEIELEKKKLEQWLLEKAGWEIAGGGGIICGLCKL